MRNLFAYISNDRSNSFSTSASPLPVSKDLREISFVPSLPPCLLVSLSAPGPGACQVLLTIVCESVSCYLSFSLRLFKEIVVIRRNWSRINGKERSIGFFYRSRERSRITSTIFPPPFTFCLSSSLFNVLYSSPSSLCPRDISFCPKLIFPLRDGLDEEFSLIVFKWHDTITPARMYSTKEQLDGICPRTVLARSALSGPSAPEVSRGIYRNRI